MGDLLLLAALCSLLYCIALCCLSLLIVFVTRRGGFSPFSPDQQSMHAMGSGTYDWCHCFLLVECKVVDNLHWVLCRAYEGVYVWRGSSCCVLACVRVCVGAFVCACGCDCPT